MIGLSVAIGRFIEALFWAIFRVAGVIAGSALLVVLGLGATWIVGRAVLRRVRR
jgi:hypothetical protein